jgi:hypothetical protein
LRREDRQRLPSDPSHQITAVLGFVRAVR